MRKPVKYNNILLMPGSKAYELHIEGKLKELATHMKELDVKGKQMLAAAERAEKANNS